MDAIVILHVVAALLLLLMMMMMQIRCPIHPAFSFRKAFVYKPALTMTGPTSVHMPSACEVSTTSVQLSQLPPLVAVSTNPQYPENSESSVAPSASRSSVDKGSKTDKSFCGGLYTHNPYWYEGFSLSNVICPQPPLQAPHAEDPRVRKSISNMQPPILPANGQHWRAPQPLLAVSMSRPRVPPALHPLYERDEALTSQWRSLRVPKGAETPPSPISETRDKRSEMGLSDSDEETRKEDQLKAELVQCILNYFGGYNGSLPSERVQNIMKNDHAELYDAVVVRQFKKKWHKFLQHCSGTFVLFSRPAACAPEECSWRIRLRSSADWEEADEKEEQLRAALERDLVEKIRVLLLQHPEYQAPVNDVVKQLNIELGLGTASSNEDTEADTFGERGSPKARKIHSSDVVRLSRRFHEFFVQEGREREQRRGVYVRLLQLRQREP